MENNILVFIVGFIIIFITYGIIFGLFLNDYSMSLISKYPSVFRQNPSIPTVALAHGLQTILILFLFRRMNINTLREGAISGFIIFALFEAIFAFFIYAIFSIIPINDILLDILLSSMIGIVVGGAIGFLAGKFTN